MALLNLRKRKRVAPDIPLCSMADIAFNLLIFFMTVTTFKDEKGLSLVLPEPGQAVAVSTSNILRLIVEPDGSVDVQRAGDTELRAVRPGEIARIWRAASEQNPNLIAVVETHPEAAYDHMIDVLDELQGAGASRISLEVFEGGKP
ncbi:MAG TPA: biopolymer transporter ExbD [Longimicrobiales bacterium]